MKKTLFKIALMIMFPIVMKAQIEINMADNIYPMDYLSNGQYYIKDVNNYLNNFSGTWEYNNGNEKFQIVLSKVTKYHYISELAKSNYYEDGIKFKYKKYSNGFLSFESENIQNPYFRTSNGVILNGYITDYGRIAKTIIVPKINRVLYPGGYPMQPSCEIEFLPTTLNEPKKIKFHLFYRHGEMAHYDKETYAGQPIFSVPNDIIMTKVE